MHLETADKYNLLFPKNICERNMQRKYKCSCSSSVHFVTSKARSFRNCEEKYNIQLVLKQLSLHMKLWRKVLNMESDAR